MAQLRVRAAKRIELRINEVRVDVAAGRNWKDICTVDVLSFLRVGRNIIAVRVFHDNGPPALWLRLDANRFTLRSDRTWQTSFAGSAWRGAVLASTPRVMVGDDPAAAGQGTVRALAAAWPIWMAFGILALILCIRQNAWRFLQKQSARETILLLLVSVLWILLFSNNSVRAPFYAGFDAAAHLDYIKYLQDRRALPLPSEGFEMFQPPLYYVSSASLLSFCGLTVSSAPSVFVLRAFAMLVGISHLILVFLVLRLLFPRRFDLQVCGLLLAAFVPMQLYMSHYVTNETLGAVLVTAALYLGLRIIKSEDVTLSAYVGLGFSLGLAILAKATGVLLIPILVIALTVKLAKRQLPMPVRFRNLGIMLAVCFAVCGWQYLRIGLHSNAPFFGMAGGLSWWQDAGYQTGANYMRVGRSLVVPFFSGAHSFADGIYSTLWGDGLWGGQSDPNYRPPWNYDLMAAGYLLALAPSAVLIAGVAAAIVRFVRKPSTECFVFLGLSGAVALGLVLMSIRVPSFAQGKAFYGLSILAPLACFGALGWEMLTNGRKYLQLALGFILLIWLMNSFASFWIRGTPSQRIYVGRTLLLEHGASAALPIADELVARFPANGNARELRASVLSELDRANEARSEAERATELQPDKAAGHLQLSQILERAGANDRAILEAQRALELAPASPAPYEILSRLFLQANRFGETIASARDGLAVSPFDAQLHFTLAEALAHKNDFINAAHQLAYTSLIQPDRSEAPSNLRSILHSLITNSDRSRLLREAADTAPDAPLMLNQLAWWFSTHPDEEVRNGAEAVRLAERACALTRYKFASLLNTLAAAYAEAGRFSNAVDTARKAMSIAQSTHDENAIDVGQELLASFQARHPFRAEPSP